MFSFIKRLIGLGKRSAPQDAAPQAASHIKTKATTKAQSASPGLDAQAPSKSADAQVLRKESRNEQREPRNERREPRNERREPRNEQREPRNERREARKDRDPQEHSEPMEDLGPRPGPPAPVGGPQPEVGWQVPAEATLTADGERPAYMALSLHPAIMHGIWEIGFSHMTPVQAMVMPHALTGQDITAKAQTGSGKTAAFLISLFNHILTKPLADQHSGQPRALILAPTRELAVQIGKDAAEIGQFCDCNVVTIFGGMDFEKQARDLGRRVDILVATPGRLLDYRRRNMVSLRRIEFLVIDEADRMLDMGFIPDVRNIISALPGTNKRVTQLYSATLSDPVLRLAEQWLRTGYTKIDIAPETVVSKDVDQQVLIAEETEKRNIILWHLKNEPVERMIIFSNRKDASIRLADDLWRHGIDLEMLTGDVPQKKRMRILEHFRSGQVKVLVATDVAGRGIHVDNVSHVVNFELPYEPEDYVHRVGRTGRAGNKGKSISFADEMGGYHLPDIEKYIGMELKCTMPPEEMVAPHNEIRQPSPFHELREELRRARRDARHGHGGHRPTSGGRGGPSRGGPGRGGPRRR